MSAPSPVRAVGVVGAGTMGRGIAQASILAGHRVYLVDPEASALGAALDQIHASIQRSVARGRVSETAAAVARVQLRTSTRLDVAAQADLIIEAAPEDLAVKQAIFADLDRLAAPMTILASNTSSLSINALASATGRPDRFLGLHFFNPAHVMRLVEVIPGDDTSEATLAIGLAFVIALGKQAVRCKDTPAFIVNRVARPFYGEALRLLGEGATDVPTIDQLARSLGFAMGPFELIDLIGCDVNLAVTESVYRATYQDPRYRPHPLQRRMVESNMLGRKTGRGYYRYEDGRLE